MSGLRSILHPRVYVPVCVGVGSVSAGLVAGYVIGHRRAWRQAVSLIQDMQEQGVTDPNQLSLDFDEETNQVALVGEREEPLAVENPTAVIVTEEQLEEMRRQAEERGHPSVPTRDPVPDDDDEYVEVVTLDHVPGESAKWEPLERKPDQTPARTNVFRTQADWDQEREEAQRDETGPYIISKDEFFENEREGDGYLQEDMTFYEGDGVLTDSSGVPQYDVAHLVGDLRFGHGSGEEHVVYVRNAPLKMEYAVTRDPSSYELEQLGDEMEAYDNRVPPHLRRFADDE